MGLQNGGLDASKFIQNTDVLGNKLDPVIDKLDALSKKLDDLDGKKAKATVSIESDGAIKDVEKLEQSFESLLKKVKGVNQKKNYFQSVENSAKDLKKAWQGLVSAASQGLFTEAEKYDNRYATTVLRCANAFEALKGDINSVSPEILEFVQNMRQLDQYSESRGYNFTVKGFEEAFEVFAKMKDAKASLNGFDLSKGFTNVKNDIKELSSLTSVWSNTTRTATQQASNGYEEEAKAVEKATEQIKALTKAEMERKLKSEHQKGEVDEWLYDYSDEENKLEKYNQKLDELKENQKQALELAVYYQNQLAKGETKSKWGGDHQESLENQIRYYHEYADAIDFVHEKLQEAIRTSTPKAEGAYGQELNTLVIIIKDLHEEIVRIHNAFVEFGRNNSSLSPILETIDRINTAINELSTSIKNINFNMNMNIYVGSDKEIEAKIESKISNALQAYQRLFDHIKMSSAGGSIINTEFFEFDINQYDTMMGKLRAYQKFIENMRKEAKELSNGRDVLYEGTDKKYWTSASAAMGQVTRAYNELKASSDTDPLQNLFGKTDLTEVTSQLELVITTIKELNQIVENGLSVNDVVNGKTTGTGEEVKGLEAVKQSVEAITTAVNEKTEAFKKENATVAKIVPEETGYLGKLISALKIVNEQLEKISSFTGIDMSKIKMPETAELSQVVEQVSSLSGNQKPVLSGDKTPLSSEQSSTATVSELDKVEDKLEAVEQQAKETVNAVEQVGKTTPTTAPIKDTFDETKESSKMDKVATATEEAVQAKNDFATANKGVQDSVDGSKSKLELEAELMESIAVNARKAADAKKEFVEANKEVKASADASIDSVEKENKALGKIAEGATTVSDNPKEAIKRKERTATKANTEMTAEQISARTDSLTKTTEKLEEDLKAEGSVIKQVVEFYDSQDNLVKTVIKEEKELDGILQQRTWTTNYDLKNGSSFSSHIDTESYDKYNKSQKKLLSDWDDAIRINKELDEARKYSEDYVISLQQSIDYEREEKEYLKERNRLLAEGKKQETEYYKQKKASEKLEQSSIAKKSNSSYDKELKLEKEINDLRIKNISASKEDIAANNILIERKQKLIQNERMYREANNLVNSDREAELINRKNTLTQELITAQEIYNKKLVESTKYADDIADYMRLLKEETLKANLGLGDKIEVSKGKGDGSAVITFIKDLGNESEITKIKVDDMLDVIEKLQSGNFDISKYNPDVSIKEKSDNARQKAVDKALKDQLTAWKGIQAIREQIAKTDPNDTKALANLQVLKRAQQQQYVEAGKILKANEDLYDKEVQLAKLEVERANTTSKIAKAKETGAKITVQDKLDGIESMKGKVENFFKYAKKGDLDTVKFEKLSTELNDIINQHGKYKKAIDQTTEETQQLEEETQKLIEVLRTNFADDTIEFANKLKAKISGIKGDRKFDEDTTRIINKINSDIEKLENYDITLFDNDDVKAATEVSSIIARIETNMTTVKASRTAEHILPEPEEISKGIGQINKILYGGYKLPPQLKNDLKELKVLYNQALDGDGNVKVTNAQFQELKNTLSKLNAEFEATGKHKSIIGSLTSRITDMNAKFLATYFSWQDWIRYAQQGFEIIKEYDKNLTEMTKVSNESIQTLKEFQKESFGLADSIGATASAVQNSTADFMRLGDSLEEAKEHAMDANILMQVSEYDNINDATSALAAMSQAWKDVDTGHINDVLNILGNNMPIATNELASSLQRSAGTLATLGATIEETAALTVAGNAILQDPDSVAAGLRTIELRMVGTEEGKEQLAALGEDVDDFVVQTESKLRESIMNLTKVESNGYKGFDILDENGNYKSFYDRMLGLAEIYEEIQEQDKKLGNNSATALIELIAGKNRSAIAGAILSSPDILTEAYDLATHADGSAQEELDKQLESIEAHIAQLKNSFQELWTNAASREFINFWIDLLKLVVDFSNKIGGLPALLAGIGGGFAAFKAFNKKDGRLKMSSLIFM